MGFDRQRTRVLGVREPTCIRFQPSFPNTTLGPERVECFLRAIFASLCRAGGQMTTNRLGKTFPGKIGFTSRALSFAALTVVLLTLPGCQSVTGNPNVAEIRIMDTSPDAPGLDVYQGANILAYNLGLGTITTYVQTTPSTYGFIADSAGTKQTLVSAQGTLLNGGQYTVLVGNYLNSLQEVILKDQSTPAPTGQMNARFLDQSTTTGAIDLYLVPSGSTLLTVKPIVTNITFNGNTGYLNIPAGTYTLVALPTGTVSTATTTSLYTGASVPYASGSARTFILIDQQVITNPGVQVITGDDYDSPAATS